MPQSSTLYVTSKGHRVTSSLTDAEAAKLLADAGATGFAADLVKAVARGRLTQGQRPWLHKLAVDKTAPPAGRSDLDAAAQSVDLAPVLALLQRAGGKLKHPRITFFYDGGTRRLKLSVAGARSKYAGDVMLTDGGPFGQNIWYGRIIATDGKLAPSRQMEPWVVLALTQFAQDPASYAAKYGHQTGSCCFCGLTLTTRESTSVGYGPVCATHYGLPWGETGTPSPEALAADAPAPDPELAALLDVL